MQLEFVPVQEFYFAITLCVRTLTEIESPALVSQIKDQLAQTYGQASTVAAAQQNTFNYVFRVHGYDYTPAEQLIVSIADWNRTLRLGSDYGWTLDQQRKPKRTEKHSQRAEFLLELQSHLQQNLRLDWSQLSTPEFC
ncbi:MAG: hypothetical protein HC934_13345 [Acaryochloridaceae cyanobacterium SU_2_1]|nr:hypothetical protein [Acaryochloridaceae cyanobacterium SU_2_1]